MKKKDDDIVWVEDGGAGFSISEEARKIAKEKAMNPGRFRTKPRTPEEMEAAYEKACRDIPLEESLSMYDEETKKWLDSDEL